MTTKRKVEYKIDHQLEKFKIQKEKIDEQFVIENRWLEFVIENRMVGGGKCSIFVSKLTNFTNYRKV